jgi:hypothetical protein
MDAFRAVSCFADNPGMAAGQSRFAQGRPTLARKSNGLGFQIRTESQAAFRNSNQSWAKQKQALREAAESIAGKVRVRVRGACALASRRAYGRGEDAPWCGAPACAPRRTPRRRAGRPPRSRWPPRRRRGRQTRPGTARSARPAAPCAAARPPSGRSGTSPRRRTCDAGGTRDEYHAYNIIYIYYCIHTCI